MVTFTDEESKIIDLLLHLDLLVLRLVAKNLRLDTYIYYINDIDKITNTNTHDDKITIVEKIVKKVLSDELIPITIYPSNVVDHDNKPSTNYVLYGTFKSTNNLWKEEFKRRNLRFGQNVFYRARYAWSQGLRLTLDQLLDLDIDIVRMKKSFAWNYRSSETDFKKKQIEAYNWLKIRKIKYD